MIELERKFALGEGGLDGLRAKLEAAPARPRHLLTAHGVGYRLQF